MLPLDFESNSREHLWCLKEFSSDSLYLSQTFTKLVQEKKCNTFIDQRQALTSIQVLFRHECNKTFKKMTSMSRRESLPTMRTRMSILRIILTRHWWLSYWGLSWSCWFGSWSSKTEDLLVWGCRRSNWNLFRDSSTEANCRWSRRTHGSLTIDWTTQNTESRHECDGEREAYNQDHAIAGHESCQLLLATTKLTRRSRRTNFGNNDLFRSCSWSGCCIIGCQDSLFVLFHFLLSFSNLTLVWCSEF